MLIKIGIITVIGTILLLAESVQAQQMIIDDAAVTTERSFQVEAWYGSEESWFQPGISLTPRLEFAPGLAFDTQNNMALANFLFETKFVNTDFEENGDAWGFVAGLVLDDDFAFDEFFAYVPYSRLILNNSSVLHLNLGAAYHDDHAELIYGIRGDFGVHDRLSILTEVFAEGTEFALHGGVRISLIPDLMEMDITYGQGFRAGQDFPGLNIGIAITPDSIW